MTDRQTSRAGAAAGRTRPLRRVGKLAAPRLPEALREAMARPGTAATAAGAATLLILCVAVLGLSRGRLLLAEGRVMDESRIVRVEFHVVDEAKTERERARRALLVPRVYTADEGAHRELEASLRTLPAAAAAAKDYAALAPEIRDLFALTPEQFEALRDSGADDEAVRRWSESVSRLFDLLANRPLVSSEESQLILSDAAARLDLRLIGGDERNVSKGDAVSIAGDNLPLFRDLAERAGFEPPLRDAVVHRLRQMARPMFLFDKSATDARRDAAAAAVPPAMNTYRKGELLARRGEVLKAEQLSLLRREHEAFRASMPPRAEAARWIGVIGVALVITAAVGVYTRLFHRELSLSLPRFLGLVLLLAGGAGAACWATIVQPGWLWATAVAPVVFTTMLAVIAFDARLGVAMAAAQAALTGAALSLPIGYAVVILSSAAICAWGLRGVRNRNDVVRAAIVVGVVLLLATAAVSLLGRPAAAQGPTLWYEILGDSLLAGLAGFFSGAMTLVLLPTVERVSGATTGMTLSEWRDPKQPLLRKLQLQAPGTFSHSHTVATLAEAAAEAVGADGLHVYVGALYHDIGKMNKPDYFVENQPRGYNRHSKLSPAMSLLVIVGHVKDGVELAREYRLPRSLIGYIETHHGTTLVEYFYDQARRQAEETAGDETLPTEVEYRYPGPKPRTKEQAILMICDAVESATRTMADPTPARIEALVHSLAHKRLMDGQFDECPLTLAELGRIEEAVSRTLASIYHGRIAYPSAETREEGEGREPPTDSRAALAEQAG